MTNLEQVPMEGATEEQIQAIRDAVLETFAMICGESPTYKGEGGAGEPSDCVAAVVSIVGKLAWSLMLGFPRETAPALVSGFTGLDIPYESSDMSDAVGELANILAGDVVARFEALGVKVEMSLPTIMRGTDVRTKNPEGTIAIRMHFECPAGPFWLGVIVGDPATQNARKPGS